jgi:hypothetical protein
MTGTKLAKFIYQNSRAGGPIGDRLQETSLHLWESMGYSVYDNKNTKNDCSCEPTHDQTQQETRHRVSGSHSEAQRQDLLRSRSQLPQSLNHYLSPAQTAELRSCVLGGDKRGRDSLRLDRGSSGEAPLHQGRAKDGSPARVIEMDQLGNLRAGQGRRSEVRCRARYRHRSRNFKSCPGLGQLQSSKKATSDRLQALSVKRQATSIPTFR